MMTEWLPTEAQVVLDGGSSAVRIEQLWAPNLASATPQCTVKPLPVVLWQFYLTVLDFRAVGEQ